MQPQTTYTDFIKTRAHTNPSVTGLLKYIKHAPQSSSSLFLLEYAAGCGQFSSPTSISAEDLSKRIQGPSTADGRILFIEDIEPSLISGLGQLLNIDPVFFADYVTTEFSGIDQAPLAPFRAFYPSQIAERGHLHIHYQQVIDLGQSKNFNGSVYQVRTRSNVMRNIRLLPDLQGRQLALMRGCCSIVLKKHGGVWYSKSQSKMCPAVVLVDPPAKTVFEAQESFLGNQHSAQPLHGGFEDFEQPPALSSSSSYEASLPWNKSSLLSSLLHYYRNYPPGFTGADPPKILSMGYYPIRIALAEWMLYLHLVSRYLMYYRYSLQTIEGRSHERDLVDLQRWPRRLDQSQHKLHILSEFISRWVEEQTEKKPWETILRDISYARSQLRRYSISMERIVPVATSMVQLLDAQRSGRHAANVTLLTVIALIFIPLSWISGLFSMSEGYLPGEKHFWVYIATALPLSIVVLILATLPFYRQKLSLGGFLMTPR
ncbi:hypothetical protein M406DRAFT_250614 [Cryphonectria parasitica EP155]|uniref:Uncharacterized protein n=1 Tax=Cryphonectria parasitica (strain ATCC 38755 / EP155) TaxID=660469 RepID=A0A9P4Y8B2_CRYP1|nr:uncharacterized protein M406DRAFT_250614 [Cryphonectria parasitica EP155]KAF3768207.1 hypothetical protein M406DRAFT_250614 [Cryphonectria parasitica EP155]